MNTKNIYLISALFKDEKIYKIGYTKRDVNERVSELKTGNPSEFVVEKLYIAKQYGSSIEKNLHNYFKNVRIKGEWFDLTESDIDNFITLCERYYKGFDAIQKNTYIEDRGIKFK